MLHDRDVSVAVTDVDKIATAEGACDEEDGLANRLLVLLRDEGNKLLLRIMRVEDVEETDEHCSHHISDTRDRDS